MNATINIGQDFSRPPGGRRVTDGPKSGQEFRDRVLVPALRAATKTGESVDVILDGPRGYLSSFLEEAFGGLVRECGFSHAALDRLLRIKALDPYYDTYRRLAMRYISEARE